MVNLYCRMVSADCHNITELMSCVHGPNNKLKNKDFGCFNPIASY